MCFPKRILALRSITLDFSTACSSLILSFRIYQMLVEFSLLKSEPTISLLWLGPRATPSDPNF